MPLTNAQMTRMSYIRQFLRDNARPSVVADLIESCDQDDTYLLDSLRAVYFQLTGQPAPQAKGANPEPTQ